MTTRVAWLFALVLTACSTTVTGVPAGPPGSAGMGGDPGAGGAGAGTGGATAASGGAAGSGGAVATAGSGGVSVGLHVDVVPGVATDCVFPSTVTPPTFTACEPKDVGLPIGYCATPANVQLPITLTNLVWDYSTLTLTATLTSDVAWTVAFGACSGPTSCDYTLRVLDSTPATITVTMTHTDRGYVMSQLQNMSATPVDSSCSDSYGQSEVNLCVQNGYWRSWAAWTVPCAAP